MKGHRGTHPRFIHVTPANLRQRHAFEVLQLKIFGKGRGGKKRAFEVDRMVPVTRRDRCGNGEKRFGWRLRAGRSGRTGEQQLLHTAKRLLKRGKERGGVIADTARHSRECELRLGRADLTETV